MLRYILHGICLAAVCLSMVETRIASRYRVDKRATAEYGGDKYPCTVRDLSSTGAAVEFRDPVKFLPIAKAFNLILPEDGLKLSCRVVWKRDFRMGVTFD
ncbi:MAG TPA: PilZ domain-containing protein [Bradyrhizobium sp.]